MNFKKGLDLTEKYQDCPNCGNDKIGRHQGGIELSDSTFRRYCKCGFDITVNEDGEQVKLICPDCEIEMKHREVFYCDNCLKEICFSCYDENKGYCIACYEDSI